MGPERRLPCMTPGAKGAKTGADFPSLPQRERSYVQGTHSHRSSVSRLSTRDLQLTSSNDDFELQRTHTQILDQLREAKRLRQVKDPSLQPSEKA
ncbi:uncharacterized protein N7483_007370 [Penicillium malachiteum]|uniref:uncharacterized protein n=1 Tax=Penicillium malachiteum TaxID=1324776 RepID=UPI0025486141|nr:uncharacterized protein N7483_007370 [Penicillium malachiteum]KAJ5726013.1 hypothetical protein N7483_007370 [Penicillium malachiteum]